MPTFSQYFASEVVRRGWRGHDPALQCCYAKLQFPFLRGLRRRGYFFPDDTSRREKCQGFGGIAGIRPA